jgi:hypothetical protein
MAKRLIGLVCTFIAMGAFCVVAADAGPRGMSVTANATNSQNANMETCPPMTVASFRSRFVHATGLVADSGSCSCSGTPCSVKTNSCAAGTRASCTRTLIGTCSCDCE